MRFRPKLSASLIATLILTNCNEEQRGPQSLTTESITIQSTGCIQPSKKSYDRPLGDMFEAAFRETPPLTRRAPQGARETCYRYEPASVIRLGAVDVLVTEAFTEDCHGCFGTLSLHYLRKVGDTYVIDGEWLSLVSGDGWGRPPNWRVRRELTPHPALEIRTQFGNNGSNCEWLSLIELTPTEPIIRIPTTAAGYDSTGAVGEHMGQSITALLKPSQDDTLTLDFEGTSAGQVTYIMRRREYLARGTNPAAKCDA